ncbi:MAG: LacI family DNA-binding transcriptional regulator [Micrococcales bacterium]
MAGIEAVAKLAGVSIATVSRALSGKGHVSERSKSKVQLAANELGYIASSSAYTLATGRNRNIGVIMPYIDRWFFGAFLESAESALVTAGYDLTVYNLNGGDEQRARIFNEFLMRRRVDAVLALAVAPSAQELEQLNRMKKPILAVGGYIKGARSLVMDDRAAGRLATEHLLSLGHTRIANINGLESSDKEFNQPNLRHHGYLDALNSAGIEPKPELMVRADFTLQSAYVVAKQILGNPYDAPTAIFCNSDEMAFGAIMAAKDLGLQVPRDISIIGIDNHDMSEFFQLTTVNQMVRDQGTEAVKILLNLLDDPSLEEHPNVEQKFDWVPELLVRNSTARPMA